MQVGCGRPCGCGRRCFPTPEPRLAIAGFGKRDASFGLGLPVPMLVRRRGGSSTPATAVVVRKLDDQHAYLDVAGTPLQVGDVVAFGISHTCTAFRQVVDHAARGR